MLGALDLYGMRAMMTVEGTTDSDVFEVVVEQVLARKLRPGDIVVLDNVGAHKPGKIRELGRWLQGHQRRLTRATAAVTPRRKSSEGEQGKSAMTS